MVKNFNCDFPLSRLGLSKQVSNLIDHVIVHQRGEGRETEFHLDGRIINRDRFDLSLRSQRSSCLRILNLFDFFFNVGLQSL